MQSIKKKTVGTSAKHKSMVPIRSLFLFSLVSILLHHVLAAPGSVEGRRTDHSALLEIKAKIVDPDGVLSAWNDTTSFCRWRGISCGRRHQRVTMLDLESLDLSGVISPHIGNLSFLRQLQLQNNSFYSTIPSEIGNLGRLQELYLNNNSFSGEIPSNLSRCSKLTLINLGRNELEGNLPAEIGSMSKLQVLILQVNNLTGHMPPSIGNMSSLQVYAVTVNNFEGRLPETLGNLKNLTRLVVGANKFSGAIPRSIFNITSLRELDVAENQFEGTLPSDLGITLPKIETISMSDNKLGGSIPNSLSNASNLVTVEIILNNLTGDVPSLSKLMELRWFSIGQNQLGAGKSDDLRFLCSLTDSTSLEILNIDANNFGGAIPECIGNLSSVTLQQLSLSYNNISGVLPTSVGNLVNLEMLLAWGNNIQGEIPASIGNLKRLNQLQLLQNEFTGQIPPSMGDLEMLTGLQLYGNKLHGAIPSTIGNCKNLLLIDLSENNLSGPIPPEILALPSLSIALFLFENNLTGPLPVEVGSLINLSLLRLNGNRLSGGIPSSISSCMKMEELHLQDNFFVGSIPTSLSSLRGLRVLNFSNNGMSGPIPQFLQFMNLTNLSISYNDFEGALPTGGIFSSVVATTVTGNKKLCGGLPEFHLPACNIKRSNKKGLSTTAKILISTSSGLIAIIFALIALYALVFRQKKTQEHSCSAEDGFPKVSYHGLSKATNGFSPENVIGTGSFGTVYRGLLDQCQQTVAIKVLNLGRYGASKSFISECEALKRIRHRNLVKVLTACSGVDHQGNDFKALVYEFLPNGNLDQWLHPIATDDRNHRELDVVKRLNIVIDVACALDYLHHQCETPIVHCDLKPSNVLLDEEMTGHLSDFGLARFLPETTHKLLAAQMSSIGVKGSFGYIAPEYATGSEISTHGDTYSFGVLILEMFTGRRPTDDIFQDSLNLHVFAKEALSNHVLDIIDPRLLHGQDERESKNNNYPSLSTCYEHSLKVRACLTSLIEIGVTCSSDLARERMDIGDVSKALQAIKDNLVRKSKKGHPLI